MKGTIGPYRISERIGTGGMGEVFKAFDDRLDRWVAIKRIRPGKEDTDENRERFLREARATAALNHSSIVHVYDIFRDGESDCIVMEYIEGRSLQSMTANGALDPLRAIELGQEVAEGLAAAHAKNILHRDLKTENIIVTPEGHAKILDFGLAKPLITEEFDSSLTGKGQLVGTSRAMSPEYVGGDQVDHRSDLFALGVLLYESVTGHSPFKAQNTLATLKQVIVHQQPPAREVNPEVPEEVSDLIDRLLEKSPEDRPQSAKEVAQELDRIGGQYSSGSVDHSLTALRDSNDVAEADWSISTTIMGNPRLRRYSIAITLIILAGLIGAYFLGRIERDVTPFDSTTQVKIVVGDFQNLTNDRLLDDSLDIAFRTGLGQSRHIGILSDEEIQAALERMKLELNSRIDRKLGIEICQREGAEALVVGNIVSVGPSYSMSAEIIEPDSKENIYTATRTADAQGEILGALQEMVQDLRKHLGESIRSVELNSQPLDKVTTSNLEALKLYSLGSSATETPEQAISLLNRAIELDPDFAMAHVQLGIIYQSTGQVDNVTHHFDQAQLFNDRLTPFEKMYVDGWQAILHKNPAEVIRIWKLVTKIYPEYGQGYHNLGMTYYLFNNKFDEAAKELRKALVHMEPKLKSAPAIVLGYCEIALGRNSEALDAFAKYDEQPGILDTHLVEMRYPEALEILDSSDEIFRLLTHKAIYHIDLGEFSEAKLVARRIIADDFDDFFSGFTARLVWIISITQQADPDKAEFTTVLDESVEEARKVLDQESTPRFLTPIPFLATLGKICVRFSELQRATRIHELIRKKAEESKIELWLGYSKMLEAEILLARGRVTEAINLLEESISLGDLFQSHESLAHAYEIAGNIIGAIEEYQWISERRGRAFAECYTMCAVRAKNIVDWRISLLRLGELFEAAGRPEEAKEYYSRLQLQRRAWER